VNTAALEVGAASVMIEMSPRLPAGIDDQDNGGDDDDGDDIHSATQAEAANESCAFDEISDVPEDILPADTPANFQNFAEALIAAEADFDAAAEAEADAVEDKDADRNKIPVLEWSVEMVCQWVCRSSPSSS
jgi:hypothetical protein